DLRGDWHRAILGVDKQRLARTSLASRVVLIRHLALSVRDPGASRDFYLRTIGRDGEARAEPWGIRVKLADGFMLALIKGEPLPAEHADTVHFGCPLAR